MPRYLVAIYHPDDYDPFVAEDDALYRDVMALNQAMQAAGAKILALGLQPAGQATSLQPRPSGEVVASAGPYLATNEHIGGFWILEAADLDEAVAWGRKAAVACRVPVEVRQFLAGPPRRTGQGQPTNPPAPKG